MLRVLQFIPSLDAHDGGTTTYLQQLTPSLGALCDLHVCCLMPHDGDTSHCVKLDSATVHFIEIDYLRRRRKMKREWLALLDALRPDILHVNCCWMPQCALVQRWFVAWRSRMNLRANAPKSCLTPHGMLEPWIIRRNYWTRKLPAIWLYQRLAVRSADAIFATAEEERSHLQELGWNPRIVMIPNGIDVDAIAMKASWQAPRNFLFMSRIHPKKGIDILLRALAQLHGLPLRLEIAGEGDLDYVASLKKMTEDLGLQGIVSFLGPVYGNRKWEVIHRADVVVLPSHSENFGLIVAEALSAGVPVITTHGTPWGSLQESRCGWWIEAAADPLAEAITEAYGLTAAEAEAMGRRGRQLVAERYDVKLQARRIAEAYAGLSKM